MSIQRILKPFIPMLVLILVPILCCGTALLAGVMENEYRLYRFANNLFEYPLPAKTAMVSRKTWLSKVGNGNNCWYQAQMVLNTELTESEIRAYVENIAIPAVPDDNDTSLKQVDLYLGPRSSLNNKLQFTIEVSDDGSDTNLDIRCLKCTPKAGQPG